MTSSAHPWVSSAPPQDEFPTSFFPTIIPLVIFTIPTSPSLLSKRFSPLLVYCIPVLPSRLSPYYLLVCHVIPVLLPCPADHLYTPNVSVVTVEKFDPNLVERGGFCQQCLDARRRRSRNPATSVSDGRTDRCIDRAMYYRRNVIPSPKKKRRLCEKRYKKMGMNGE